MKLILFFTLLFSFYSCSDLDKGKQIEAISAMNLSLDSMQTTLFENKIDSITYLKIAANQVELRIKQNYDVDTIDMAFGRKMDAYKVMRRTFKPLGQNFSVLKNGIKEEKIALANLKTDIENGDGERNKYDEHVLFEQNKISQLRSLLKEYVIQKNKTMKTFNELHDELNAYSMELLAKHKKAH